MKYLGTCSPALRQYFHCHGRKRRASRYHRALVFPEETEEERITNKNIIYLKSSVNKRERLSVSMTQDVG